MITKMAPILLITAIAISAGQGKIKRERRAKRAQEMVALVAKHAAEKKVLEEKRKKIEQAVEIARAEQEGYVFVEKQSASDISQ